MLSALRAASDAISRRPLCPRRRQRNNKLIIVVAELRMTARRRRRPFESDAETKSQSHARGKKSTHAFTKTRRRCRRFANRMDRTSSKFRRVAVQTSTLRSAPIDKQATSEEGGEAPASTAVRTPAPVFTSAPLIYFSCSLRCRLVRLR